MLWEVLGLAILLGPPSKKEARFLLRTGIFSHSRSHFCSEKERATKGMRSRMSPDSYREKNKKKSPDKTAKALSFCGEVRTEMEPGPVVF